MLYYLVTAVISVSAGVIGMGMWCGAAVERLREQRDRDAEQWSREKEACHSLIDAADNIAADYATERRKRLDAEQAHALLSEKHASLLEKAYIRDGARFVRVVK